MTAIPEFSDPDGVPAPLGPYSHVATVPAGSELLFISGQIGIDTEGRAGTTIAEQSDQAFSNLVGILKAQALEVESIVKLTVFIVAGQDGEPVRQARLKHMGSHKPASSTFYVAGLVRPEWLIEVEAVAVRASIR